MAGQLLEIDPANGVVRHDKMSEIFWGTPHKHVPVIGGIQFHFWAAYTDKATADRIAVGKRNDGQLARVQKKAITSRFGNKIKTIGHCYAVFVAHPKGMRRK
jgi:hypothetical protein